jgi:hypothetical protein
MRFRAIGYIEHREHPAGPYHKKPQPAKATKHLIVTSITA